MYWRRREYQRIRWLDGITNTMDMNLSQGIFNPGIEPSSPTLQVDSLPAEPQGKPKNNGMDSLSLLQWIFPIQELNQGLLLCRRIFYQLIHRESLHHRANFHCRSILHMAVYAFQRYSLYLSHPLLPPLCNSGVFIIPFYLLCWLLAITLCLVIIVALGLRVYTFKLSEFTCKWYYTTLNRV